MPSRRVISFSLPAMSICSCSRLDDAGTGDQEERLVEPDLEAAELHATDAFASQRAAASRMRLVLERGAHEADEQRMAVARRGRELRMELAADEPRMRSRQLDHLDQQVVASTCRRSRRPESSKLAGSGC